MRRADGEPRPAARLCQRGGSPARHRAGQGDQGARAEGRRPRVRDAGQLRRLRRLGAIQHRFVADRLRHRLPDARQGAGLQRQSAGLHAGARPAAELHRLCGGLRERRRGPGLRALRSRPQRPRADRRPALLRRHAHRPLLEPARQGAARRRTGDDGRQDAGRACVRRRARLARRKRSDRHLRLSGGLRLRPARQRCPGHARRRRHGWRMSRRRSSST